MLTKATLGRTPCPHSMRGIRIPIRRFLTVLVHPHMKSRVLRNEPFGFPDLALLVKVVNSRLSMAVWQHWTAEASEGHLKEKYFSSAHRVNSLPSFDLCRCWKWKEKGDSIEAGFRIVFQAQWAGWFGRVKAFLSRTWIGVHPLAAPRSI